MPEDYRPTEPVYTDELHARVPPDDGPAAPPPPERSPKGRSLLWVGVVVLVFLAVPLFANFATRTPVRAKAPVASAPVASAPAVEAASAVEAPRAEVQSQPATPVPDRPAPLPARALPDPARQVVTKCIERGRVVYTQTGDCTGSVSAVPIDTGKNVVGPGREASRP